MTDRRDPRQRDPDAHRRQGAIWALCLLGATLTSLTTVLARNDDGAPPPCSRPREVSAERGWTRSVGCGPQPGGGRPLRGPARWLYGLRIDVGSADERLLEALPGIGPARARAIVEARRRAPFESVSDLERVHGIGPRTVERLQPWLRVDPRAPAGVRSRGPDRVGTTATPDRS